MANKERIINLKLLKMRIWKILVILKWPFFIILFAGVIVTINRLYFNNTGVNHELILKYLTALQYTILLITGALVLSVSPKILSRIKSLGPSGVELYPISKQQTGGQADELPDLTEEESDVKVDISTSEGRQQVLGNFQIKWYLEKIYRIIFGTQIELLYTLNSFRAGLKQEDLIPIYEKHRSISTTPYPTFIEFVNYLALSGLIEHSPSSGLFKITDTGLLFLDYLAQEELSAATRPM